MLAGTLAVGFSAVLLWYSRRNPAEGTVGASLQDAGYTVLGAGAGLLVGSALTSFVRRDSRFLGGVLAGVIAFVALVVAFVVMTPTDLSRAEILLGSLFLGVPLTGFVLVGSTLGSLLSDLREP
jgi:hypothetical protein